MDNMEQLTSQLQAEADKEEKGEEKAEEAEDSMGTGGSSWFISASHIVLQVARI